MDYNICFVLAFYLIGIAKLILVLWGVLDVQFKRNKLIYLTMLIPPVFIIFISQLLFEDYVLLYETVTPFLIIITITLIFQGRLFRKISITLLAYICIIFLDVCIAGILSIVLDTTLAGIIENPYINLFGNSINIVVFAIITLIKRKRNRHLNTRLINRNVYALFFLGASVGIFFIASLMIISFPGAEDSVRKAILFLLIVVIIAYFAICTMLIVLTYSRDKYKQLSQINKGIILSQQRYYTLVKEKQQEIKAIKHDMKNHLSCINALYKGGKLDELHNYINDLIEQSKTLDELLDTGNDIVNAILNDAQGRYIEQVIINLEGAFPDELYIASMDLCIIISNAINNAIEAIHRIKQSSENPHQIHVKIGTYKNDLFIDISNPTNKDVNILNGRIETTKEDKNFHGFGTENMRRVAMKYGGNIEFKSDDKMFYVNIHMINKANGDVNT